MPFTQIRDDVRLFCADEGEGPVTLLFVHGWTCDSHDWDWQLEHFARSARVIAVDLRGHGQSSVPSSGYDARVFAEDLVLLLRAIDVPKVVVIGHSLGGGIGIVLAGEYPDLVAGFVAVEPAYGFAPAHFIHTAETMTTKNAHELTAAIMDFADSPHTPDFFRAMHRRRVWSVPSHVVIETFQGNWLGAGEVGTRERTEAYLDRMTCPTLTIFSSGHEDHAAWAAKRVRSELDGTLYLSLGHWPHQETPGLLNSVIETWLNRLSQ
ncbi:alpha/beta hydrolase [Kibdelosporangium philippinense]|uniref:Alpha/beta hydrolase n=1 Tax=Kibdelosporangium philippinense TaxID=211113 RepID=A0ABS8ZMC5_9PSEU|nr:alpha/beta hydrolase [Kibdelosporangium philippinense]MCE7008679.1 alpha/beta hydrolase [Kibdelosporangium philippinense]